MLQAGGCELWLQGYGLGLSYFLCCSLCRITTDLLAHAALLVFLWQIYHQLLNAAATAPVLPSTGLHWSAWSFVFPFSIDLEGDRWSFTVNWVNSVSQGPY